MNRLYFSISSISVCLVLGISTPLGQTLGGVGEPVSSVGKIEFSNESLIVLRMHMAPHEQTPMHDIDSPRLVIWLTDSHLRDTGTDGSATEYSRIAGSIDWITPRSHMGENLGDQSISFLVVVPKGPAESKRASPH
jgi:hypothetical protein